MIIGIGNVGSTSLKSKIIDINNKNEINVLGEANLHPDIGLGAAAMGEEGFFPAHMKRNLAFGRARQQAGDQLKIQRLAAVAEAAADERLDHPDL